MTSSISWSPPLHLLPSRSCACLKSLASARKGSWLRRSGRSLFISRWFSTLSRVSTVWRVSSSVRKNAARLLQPHDTRQRGVKDAWKRSRAGRDVQLRLDGGENSRGSSSARGEADGG